MTDETGLTAAVAQDFGDAGATLAALYPLSEFDGGYPNPFQAALTRMKSDQMLICNTYDSAQLSAGQGVPAYTYNFDISAASFLGACHGSELPYVFGTGTQLTAGSQQAAASALMERYWTRFASKGDPSGGSDPAWPSFSASSNQRMQFTLAGPERRLELPRHGVRVLDLDVRVRLHGSRIPAVALRIGMAGVDVPARPGRARLSAPDVRVRVLFRREDVREQSLLRFAPFVRLVHRGAHVGRVRQAFVAARPPGR